MPKPKSRAQRWADATNALREALDSLREVQGEYQEWRDNLPENLSTSALAEKLDAVCELDLDSVEQAVDEAEGLDLPKGFGRD